MTVLSHSDVEVWLAQAAAEFRQLYWMWKHDRIEAKPKLACTNTNTYP